MTFKTINKELAVTQPIVDKLEGEKQGALMMIGQKTNLTEVTMVFGHELNGTFYPPGTKVLVKGDIMGSTFTRQVLKFKDKSFILLPENHVVAVESSTPIDPNKPLTVTVKPVDGNWGGN
jgi:hypothetical protein